MRIAVLVSGHGTTLEALTAARLPVSAVVADRPSRALIRGPLEDCPALLIERSFGPDFDRDAYSADLARHLRGLDVDIVAMAGFGTILGAPMHAAFPGRILNTHPSLLPAFKGWHAVRDALDAGVKVTGCTVHVAGLKVDTGRILAQEAVRVLPGDDEASLHGRIKDVEGPLYAEVLRSIVGD